MACIVMACVVMACIVMACMFMAHVRPNISPVLKSLPGPRFGSVFIRATTFVSHSLPVDLFLEKKNRRMPTANAEGLDAESAGGIGKVSAGRVW